MAIYNVSTDAQWVSAHTAATSGDKIVLTDDADLGPIALEKQGVDVYAETKHVGKCAKFALRAPDCEVYNFKVQAKTAFTYAPNLGNEVTYLFMHEGQTGNSEVHDLYVRGGNPSQGFIDFDPAYQDPAYGVPSDPGHSTATHPAESYLCGFATKDDHRGSLIVKNCTLRDLGQGVKWTTRGTSPIIFNGNSIGRAAGTGLQLAFDHEAGSLPNSLVDISANEIFDWFIQVQDKGLPHADIFQFLTNELTWLYALSNVYMLGNLAYLLGEARGQNQRIFLSDWSKGILGPRFVDNLMLTRKASCGIVAEGDGAFSTAAALWAIADRNLMATNPARNVNFGFESGGSSPAVIKIPRDKINGFMPRNAIRKNFVEQGGLLSENDHEDHKVIGLGSPSNLYTEHFNGPTGGWATGLTTRDKVIEAFTPKAGFEHVGPIRLGMTLADQLVAKWHIDNVRPWSEIDPWASWERKGGVAPGATVSSGPCGVFAQDGELPATCDKPWRIIPKHATTKLPVTGAALDAVPFNPPGAFNIKDMNHPQGGYLEVQVVAGASPLESTFANVTIGGKLFQFEATVRSDISLPEIRIPPTAQFRPLANDPLGGDSDKFVMAIRYRREASGHPASTATLVGDTNQRLALQYLSTGFMRNQLTTASLTSAGRLQTQGLLPLNTWNLLIMAADLSKGQIDGTQVVLNGQNVPFAGANWTQGAVINFAYALSKNTLNFSQLGFDFSLFFLQTGVCPDITTTEFQSRLDATLIGDNGEGVLGYKPQTCWLGTSAQLNDAATGFGRGTAAKIYPVGASTSTALNSAVWPPPRAAFANVISNSPPSIGNETLIRLLRDAGGKAATFTPTSDKAGTFSRAGIVIGFTDPLLPELLGYTPTEPGTHTITFTNTGNYTNPAPITLTVAAPVGVPPLVLGRHLRRGLGFGFRF